MYKPWVSRKKYDTMLKYINHLENTTPPIVDDLLKTNAKLNKVARTIFDTSNRLNDWQDFWFPIIPEWLRYQIMGIVNIWVKEGCRDGLMYDVWSCYLDGIASICRANDIRDITKCIYKDDAIAFAYDPDGRNQSYLELYLNELAQEYVDDTVQRVDTPQEIKDFYTYFYTDNRQPEDFSSSKIMEWLKERDNAAE